jgi:ligand-binding sensor domain-containing protein
MKKLCIIVFILGLFSFSAFSQEYWKNYVSDQNVKFVDFKGDEIWVVTDAGITIKNSKTGDLSLLDNTNSPMKSLNIVGMQIIDGVVYFATEIEIYVVKGKSWTIYNKENTGINYNSINYFHVDENLNLWCISNEDVYCKQGNTWKFVTNIRDHNSIKIISNENEVCIMNSFYLFRIDRNLNVKMIEKLETVNNYANLTGMDYDKEENLWISFFYIENSEIKSYFARIEDTIIEKISVFGGDRYISDLKSDRNGSFYFVLKKKGLDVDLYKFDKVNFSKIENSYKNKFQYNYFEIDKGKNLWACAENGLYVFSGDSISREHISRLDELDNIVLDIVEYDGGIYIGTAEGLYVYNYKEFEWAKNIMNYKTYTKELKNFNNMLWIIANSNNPHPYSSDYLYLYNDSGAKYFPQSITNISGNIIDIAFNNKVLYVINKTLAGRYNILSYNNNKWDYYDKDKSIFMDDVISLVSDNKGNLWCLTKDLIKHNVYKTVNFQIPKIALKENVQKIFYDDCKDLLWLTGYTGMMSFNGTEWKTYLFEDLGLPKYLGITDILSSTSGDTWIATSTGLVKFDKNGSWKLFNTTNSPLANNYVNTLYINSKNQLWIGTNNGISVLTQMDEKTKFGFTYQNYPNPASTYTNVFINTQQTGTAQIRIVDLSGKVISTIEKEIYEPGHYIETIDCSTLKPGNYIYQVSIGDQTQAGKMVITR